MKCRKSHTPLRLLRVEFSVTFSTDLHTFQEINIPDSEELIWGKESSKKQNIILADMILQRDTIKYQKILTYQKLIHNS